MEFFHSENDPQNLGHRGEMDTELSLLEQEFKTSPYFSPMAAPMPTSMPTPVYDGEIYHDSPTQPLQIPDILTPQTMPQDAQFDLSSHAYPPVYDHVDASAHLTLGMHEHRAHERSHSTPEVHAAKQDGGTAHDAHGTAPAPNAAAARQASQQPRSRQASGKITKQSPQLRWRNQTQMFEDEFMLGEPAMDVAEPAVKNEELDDKLRNAIATTQRVVSRSTSRHGSVANSRRTSATSIRQSAPWIRPRQSVSADPSPLLQSQDVTDPLDDVLTKSNYQNIVDGTHHHLGFQTVDRVTTELRTKKTVHKLAEQERRNRMNNAIVELNKVLSLGSGNEKTANSKAATVESATKYIIELQQRIAELEARCDAQPANENARLDKAA